MASSSVAPLRPTIVTVAPACFSARAISRPMPRPPPVTIACTVCGSPDMRAPPFISLATTDRQDILNFKLLQQHGRSGLTLRLPWLAFVSPAQATLPFQAHLGGLRACFANPDHEG